MKRIILLLLFIFSLYTQTSLAGVKPLKRDRQETTPKLTDTEKRTPNQIITPKKCTCKRNRLLEKIKLANPGQNARLLLRSPLHLRTFYPGTVVYTVR